MSLADEVIQGLMSHLHMMGEVRTLAAINAVLAVITFTLSFLVSKSLVSSWSGVLAWVTVLGAFICVHIVWLEKVIQPCIDCYKESDDPNFGPGFLLFAFLSQPLVAIAGWLIGPIWYFVGGYRTAGRQ
jgi:hypothetical protein